MAASERPVFIGGLAHTGKTPLRLMLSSHPNLAMTRRTSMWSRFYDRYGVLSEPANFERCLEAMLQHAPIQALQPQPERIRSEFRQGAPTYARLFALFHTHHAERLGKPRWGDQLGFVERFADVIFAAFPDAKLIQMVRDPRARYVASTGVSRSRKGKAGWAAARWLFSASLARRNLQCYPQNVKVVQYEALVAEPEETLRAICVFLNENFAPEMLVVANAASDDTDGLVETSLSNKTLSPGEIAFTQTVAGQEMRALDYNLQPIHFSLAERLMFYLVDWPANRAGMAVWNAWRARHVGAYLQGET